MSSWDLAVRFGDIVRGAVRGRNGRAISMVVATITCLIGIGLGLAVALGVSFPMGKGEFGDRPPASVTVPVCCVLGLAAGIWAVRKIRADGRS